MSNRSKRVPLQVNAETILVIEPDVLVRMVIADYLRGCGYKVIEATGAEEAMTILNAGRKIDAVFSEVKLQGAMDGFLLAQWIRVNHPRMEVILTTGVTATADKAGELCDEGPLEKPYHPRQVVRRLRILFERRRKAGR
jgi:DNA-binding response OmpR family regulator